MSSRIVLEIPEDHACIAMVRQIGRTLLEHHAVPQPDIDDIEVVVGELCANVTRHAHSEAHVFRVEMEHQGDRVMVTVTDHGTGFDPEAVPPVGAVRADEDGTDRHGGFGLHLVRLLMDNVQFSPLKPHGTRVCAYKGIRSLG